MNMNEALDKYMSAIVADYAATRFPEWMQEKFRTTVKYTMGKKYARVITDNSVHSFVVMEDDGRYRKGDILKAAGWKTPAKNSARGNIFDDYETQWTGAPSLR